MHRQTRAVVLLVAEDDEDDFLLIRKAMQDARLSNELRRVKDGKELMDYLYARDEYADAGKAPCPGIILLDLNMPRKDGREALQEIKADPDLKGIPVIVFTTSGARRGRDTELWARSKLLHSETLEIRSFRQCGEDLREILVRDCDSCSIERGSVRRGIAANKQEGFFDTVGLWSGNASESSF